MRSWQPATATKTRRRHSKAVWWATPQSSAAASTGTFHVMGSTKRIQVAKSFLQFSKMVPDRAPKRARQSGHLNLRCPAGVLPSLAARPDARSGGRPGAAGTPLRPRRRSRIRCCRQARASAACRDSAKSASVMASTPAARGSRLMFIRLSRPPRRPPDRDVAKLRDGWTPG